MHWLSSVTLRICCWAQFAATHRAGAPLLLGGRWCRSISPASTVLSSKRAVVWQANDRTDTRTDRQTDKRTDGRPTVSQTLLRILCRQCQYSVILTGISADIGQVDDDAADQVLLFEVDHPPWERLVILGARIRTTITIIAVAGRPVCRDLRWRFVCRQVACKTRTHNRSEFFLSRRGNRNSIWTDPTHPSIRI